MNRVDFSNPLDYILRMENILSHYVMDRFAVTRYSDNTVTVCGSRGAVIRKHTFSTQKDAENYFNMQATALHEEGCYI